MISQGSAYSGFSVDDIPAAKAFYADVLGLEVQEANGMLRLHVGGGTGVLVYPKGDDHHPASFTILNFPVDDIDTAVADLEAKGSRSSRACPTRTTRA